MGSSRDKPNELVFAPIAFVSGLRSNLIEIMLLIVPLIFLLAAPFNKVEESFQTQAIHDIMFHQTDVMSYDHIEFPGVVPRSFIGPLVVAIPTYMIHLVLFNIQQTLSLLWSTTTLALFNSAISPLPPQVLEPINRFVGIGGQVGGVITDVLPTWIASLLNLPPPVYPKFLPQSSFFIDLFQYRLTTIHHHTTTVVKYSDWLGPMLIARGVMGFISICAMIILMRSIGTRFGQVTALSFGALVLQQFHTMFYSTRVLANVFALQLVTIAFALILQLHPNPTKLQSARIPKRSSDQQPQSKRRHFLLKYLQYSYGSSPTPPKPITHITFPLFFGLFNISFRIESVIAALLTFTAVIYRCDMLIYIGSIGLCYAILYPLWNTLTSLSFIQSRVLSFAARSQPPLPTIKIRFTTILTALTSLLIAALLSTTIDSYFWQKGTFGLATNQVNPNSFCPMIMSKFSFPAVTPFLCSEFVYLSELSFWPKIKFLIENPLYILPYLHSYPPFLPELQVLLYNTVENRSSDWGESEWHWYFTSALPKILLTAVFLFPLAIFGTAASNSYFSSLFTPCSELGQCEGKGYEKKCDGCQAAEIVASPRTEVDIYQSDPNTGNNTNDNDHHQKPAKSSTRKQPSEFDQLMTKMESKAQEKRSERDSGETISTPSSLSGVWLNTTLLAHTFPIILFIALYSILPHKELRFILPVIPSLFLIPAIGLAKIVTYLLTSIRVGKASSTNKQDKEAPRHVKNTISPGFATCQLFGLLLSLTVSITINYIMFLVSAFNYPGGQALMVANDLARYHLRELDHFGHPHPLVVSVHIDNAAAISGVSRFGQLKRYTLIPQSGLVFTADDTINVIKGGLELESITEKTKTVFQEIIKRDRQAQEPHAPTANIDEATYLDIELMLWGPVMQGYSAGKTMDNIIYSKKEGLDPQVYNAEAQFKDFSVLIQEKPVEFRKFHFSRAVTGFDGFAAQFPYISLQDKSFVYKHELTFHNDPNAQKMEDYYNQNNQEGDSYSDYGN